MPRLKRGEDPHIDHINDLVEIAKTSENKSEVQAAFAELLDIFKPMMYKICAKWARYFHDETYKIKRFNELMADAQYWFMQYTLDKYTIDGVATFNTFIKNHIDQRIRYIYECELHYYKNNIFPDPAKNDAGDDEDQYEQVVYKYSSNGRSGMIDDMYAEAEMVTARKQLAQRMLEVSTSGKTMLTEREKKIFREIYYDGLKQKDICKEYNISITRLQQMLRKIKKKVYSAMNDDKEIWRLVLKADIDFEEK